MSKASIASLVLCFLAVGISAQQTPSCQSKDATPLLNDKPTVYITLETADDTGPTTTRMASSGNDTEDGQKGMPVIWLRLHNNTRWAIHFATESLYVGRAITPMRLCDGRPILGLRNDLKVNVRYEIDSPAGSPGRIDMFSGAWLPSGRSILFSVPRELTIGNFTVYLPFNYEWEYGERLRTDEPEHRVYFRASDLFVQLQNIKHKQAQREK